MFSRQIVKFSTLNKHEMKQFDQISEWWHPSGPMHILYKYNYERVQFLKKYVTKQKQVDAFRPLNNMKIMDVGCGAGFLTKSLARLGADVIGLDPNSSSFRQATEHRNKQSQELDNLRYYNQTLEEYLATEDGRNKQFDIVTSMDVIEHVDNPNNFLKSIANATKEGGLVMVSTIAKNPVTWLTHIALAEYITRIVPKGTHNYQKFINPNQLQQMLLTEGLTVVDKCELDLNWKGQFVQKSGGGNYILLAQKSQLSKVNQL